MFKQSIKKTSNLLELTGWALLQGPEQSAWLNNTRSPALSSFRDPSCLSWGCHRPDPFGFYWVLSLLESEISSNSPVKRSGLSPSQPRQTPADPMDQEILPVPLEVGSYHLTLSWVKPTPPLPCNISDVLRRDLHHSSQWLSSPARYQGR